jgi:Zn-dependent protease/CBS domain-containing protein
MSVSLKTDKIFGVPIKIHWSFWLVILWAGGEGVRWTGNWRGAWFAGGAMLLFFVCVVLHELGHAFAAKAFGAEVKGIILLPIGGIAQIRRLPRQGWQELTIALAGPLVNFLIALVLGDLFLVLWGPSLVEGFLQSPGTVLLGIARSVFSGGSAISLMAYLVIANLLLALFNLIPAFPMDGGRIFRALLTMFFSYKTATRIAVRIGQLLAVFSIFLTLTPYFGTQSPSAVLIAVFVFIGAAYEDKLVQSRWKFNNLRVVDVNFSENIIPILPNQRLNEIMEQAFKSPQHDLPVVLHNKLVGMLRRDDLLLALQRGKSYLSVEQVMRKEYPAVGLRDSLQTVQNYMTSTQFATLPVLEGGNLVGVINLHDVNNAYAKANIED